jgi:hypothetical protein
MKSATENLSHFFAIGTLIQIINLITALTSEGRINDEGGRMLTAIKTSNNKTVAIDLKKIVAIVPTDKNYRIYIEGPDKIMDICINDVTEEQIKRLIPVIN